MRDVIVERDLDISNIKDRIAKHQTDIGQMKTGFQSELYVQRQIIEKLKSKLVEMGSRLIECKLGSITSTSSREIYMNEEVPSISSFDEPKINRDLSQMNGI